MPPNAKGGKGYKKGKHSSDQEAKYVSCDEGQMYGRILKALGNRRFRVFCNDSKERLCRLCGSMRKSEWVEEGKVVILSIRGFGTSTTGGAKVEEMGDILTIVDPRTYSKVKKEPGVNPMLFTNVEEQDAAEIKRKVLAVNSGNTLDIEDDLFDRGEEEETSEDSEASEGSEEDYAGMTAQEKKLAIQKKYDEKTLMRGKEIQNARSNKYKEEDIDIDAI